MKKTETLCWTCKFCTGATKPHPRVTKNNGLFQCPWASRLEPVEGWTAAQKTLKVSPEETTTTYFVEGCPYYIADLEAQIEALTPKEIANKLEISSTFVSQHLKISKQVLYTYTKLYNNMLSDFKKKNPEAKQLPIKARYNLKKEIINDILQVAIEELQFEQEDNDSSDEEKYNTSIKQQIPDCQEMLRSIEYHYKQKVKKLNAAASQNNN